MIITNATADDAAALRALLMRSWMENWAPHLPPEAVERFRSDDPVSEYLACYLPDMLVARSNGRVVGMLHVVEDLLAAVHVLGGEQGNGIGTALVAHAESVGARRLEVRAFNTRAIDFYRRRGWSEAQRYMGEEMEVDVQTILMARDGQPVADRTASR